MDIPLIRTFSMAPSVSKITGFDCTGFTTTATTKTTTIKLLLNFIVPKVEYYSRALAREAHQRSTMGNKIW